MYGDPSLPIKKHKNNRNEKNKIKNGNKKKWKIEKKFIQKKNPTKLS